MYVSSLTVNRVNDSGQVSYMYVCELSDCQHQASTPSSVIWKRIFLPRHSLNFSKLHTSHFVLLFDFENCSWRNL